MCFIDNVFQKTMFEGNIVGMLLEKKFNLAESFMESELLCINVLYYFVSIVIHFNVFWNFVHLTAWKANFHAVKSRKFQNTLKCIASSIILLFANCRLEHLFSTHCNFNLTENMFSVLAVPMNHHQLIQLLLLVRC